MPLTINPEIIFFFLFDNYFMGTAVQCELFLLFPLERRFKDELCFMFVCLFACFALMAR